MLEISRATMSTVFHVHVARSTKMRWFKNFSQVFEWKKIFHNNLKSNKKCDSVDSKFLLTIEVTSKLCFCSIFGFVFLPKYCRMLSVIVDFFTDTSWFEDLKKCHFQSAFHLICIFSNNQELSNSLIIPEIAENLRLQYKKVL